jgi:hypothetical protein
MSVAHMSARRNGSAAAAKAGSWPNSRRIGWICQQTAMKGTESSAARKLSLAEPAGVREDTAAEPSRVADGAPDGPAKS